MALGLGLGVPFAAVMRGGLGVAGFLLRLIASGAADQSLSDATTYDPDNSDFVLDGQVTTSITGSASIASGELVLNNAGLYGESRTRESGRLFAVEFKVPTGGINYFGHHSALAVSTNIEGFRINGTTLQAALQGTFLNVGTVTVGQTYTLYVDVDTTGFFGFIEGGTEYTTPKLVFRGGVATGSIVENVNETAAVDSSYLSLKTPDQLYTGQITPIIEDNFTGSGSVDGRTPDTKDNGNTWVDPTGNATVSGGEVLPGNTGANDTNVFNIDCGEVDHYVISTDNPYGNTNSASASVVAARVDQSGGYAADGTPNDCVLAVHRTDTIAQQLFIFEITGGSSVTQFSGSTPTTDRDSKNIHLRCVGNEAFVYTERTLTGGSPFGSATLANQLTGTAVGAGVRDLNGSIGNTVQRFRVYNASQDFNI